MKFDQKTLEGLKPNGKLSRIPDPKNPGLYLQITKAGVKTYILVYRMGGRGCKQTFLKIASFQDLPLVLVREKARAYRAMIDAGIDPEREIEKSLNAGITVTEAVNRFMTDYAPSNLKPNSINRYGDVIRKYIIPKLGKIPIKDLDRKTVADWHTKGEFKIQMNRALAVLSSICTQAEVWEMRPQGSNPCMYVNRNKETPRIRDIREVELRAIGKAMKKFEDRFSLWSLTAIKVIAMCAGRVSEILGLRYDHDLYLNEGYALLREHKTSKTAGAKRLELPPDAVKLIRALPQQEGSHWVFPGVKVGEHISRGGLYKIWEKICIEAEVEDLRLHDFRSFAASEGLDQGIDFRVTATVLGHASPRTTERHYLKVRKTKAAEAAEKISKKVAKHL